MNMQWFIENTEANATVKDLWNVRVEKTVEGCCGVYGEWKVHKIQQKGEQRVKERGIQDDPRN